MYTCFVLVFIVIAITLPQNVDCDGNGVVRQNRVRRSYKNFKQGKADSIKWIEEERLLAGDANQRLKHHRNELRDPHGFVRKIERLSRKLRNEYYSVNLWNDEKSIMKLPLDAVDYVLGFLCGQLCKGS